MLVALELGVLQIGNCHVSPYKIKLSACLKLPGCCLGGLYPQFHSLLVQFELHEEVHFASYFSQQCIDQKAAVQVQLHPTCLCTYPVCLN